MDDMTQSCVDIASLKNLYEKPKNLVRDPEIEMFHAFKYFPGIIYGTSNLPLMSEKAHLY